MIEAETSIDIPFSTSSQPYLTLHDKVTAAFNSALLLESKGYDGPTEDLHSLDQLQMDTSAAMASLEKPLPTPKTPEGAKYVMGILNEFDMHVVRSGAQLRNYVTNRLIIESTNADAGIRMRALEALGRIRDVGLFSTRVEVDPTLRTNTELTETLRAKLKQLKTTVTGISEVDDAVIIEPPIRLDRPPTINDL